MADLSITTPDFTAGTKILSSEVDTNNSDITSYINARNQGNTDWDFMSSAGLITGKALIRLNDGLVGGPAYSFTSDTDTGIFRTGADAFDLVTAGVSVVKLDAIGSIIQPLQPSFLATAPSNTTNVTGNGAAHTIEFDTEVYDQNADFNTGTFTFTAPVTGRYLLTVEVEWSGSEASAITEAQLSITTSNRLYLSHSHDTELVNTAQKISVIADMDVNDTASIVLTISGGTQTIELINSALLNYFSGSLIN